MSHSNTMTTRHPVLASLSLVLTVKTEDTYFLGEAEARSELYLKLCTSIQSYCTENGLGLLFLHGDTTIQTSDDLETTLKEALEGLTE